MKKIFVYGTGTMGRGIAINAAQSGYQVLFCNDVFPNEVKENIDMISASLGRRLAKGKMTQEAFDKTMGLITASTKIEDCKEADFIIETIIEDVEIKKMAFEKMEAIKKDEAIFLSNTTSCSITEISSKLKDPTQLIGFHYFNPAHIMKLLEIMPGILTSKETTDKARDLAISLGKDPVVTYREGPAGVTSRILAGLLNEAVWVLHEGIAGVADIDKACVLGCNHKLGPLELIDLIGIDIHLAKTKMLYQKTGDARYRPCFLLEQMVSAGQIGKKAGKGFYEYSEAGKKALQFIHVR
ncbi:3-hydroxybutyryl-CoA dehydrogenase [Acidaminobacter sp. JC074]|uniref:3-hydroxyacyl-CoA dehydrogenase family protein n=1 Tax=Acidaminobacter sp. JC074 TaxID=2530199 RepID=UPI001F0E46F4|nr:3-hydroxyacyl-CoA dehydrogenase NAD-binding domain-containing protein [Acidaminobacter sp. JC074]MCH4889016.1 3-hydroxybutyryl-CoA dehydrogenase [Acidaminobacter sp. JC074]